ncbi:MAG: hypothetical protein VB070_13175 [Clostridiaceae bacterium]|nr:hypothetical protein [Clostridiaceae bacterium]
MLTPNQISRYNSILVKKLSVYLNREPDFIQACIIDELVHECGITREDAFSVVLAAAVGLDTENNADDKALFENYFPNMAHYLDKKVYRSNPYYKNIKIPVIEIGKWAFRQERYKPYEAFECDDFNRCPDGRIIPQIGFFDSEFSYPAVLENGREWMMITPNEIATMQPAIEKASGRVLTYGLGLGYYAYMVSEKDAVASVTVVENDETIIKLFQTCILPQFAYADKIEVVKGDAFVYAEKQMAAGQFDLVFTDLWHDPSDGVELYLKMKSYEKYSPRSTFMYWIEKTILCYL